ncbi:Oligopeptidase A [Saliniradius amylolyticus]|uniref:oligopeptidase A n=1 Tax=Saliniradius amylolyticus TaxID=2183582 RepID=A0A2S2E6H8_9ALTE|nr:oligopeptidase A [Saliniradius amylolyticus]AWL13248.1 Oligopeptidase A [Saliniradius amylolyticus]
MTTVLEQTHKLPAFSDITPEQVKPAIERAISRCKEEIEKLAEQTEISWHSFEALEEADDHLGKVFSPISHMNSVVSTDELREAHDACLPLLSEYSTYVGQHEGLYSAYKSLRESTEFANLSKAQQKVVTNAIRDFELSGVALPEEKKKRYAEIQSRLSDLSSQFSNNLMDATFGWFKQVTDKTELAGLPESALDAAAQTAEQKELDGWVFTLDIPSYLPVMLYADNAKLREEMYVAFTTKASDKGPNAGKWDNSAIMDEILNLRQEQAELLGFNNYAALSLATKMAESTEQVMGFLDDLAKRSKPQAEQDLQAVKDFAAKEHGVTELNAWDLAYYSEKLKQAKYAISDEQLRPYFPEPKVIQGLFEVVRRLYGLTIKPVNGVDTWHKDVTFYEIIDQSGDIRGNFYMDLYARPKKQGGAWMDVCRDRRRLTDGDLQRPVAYLTCNFNGPVGDKPALFTHDEVVTLFHEFGHGLHHMLTKVEATDVAGINGVAWDAVELPSQFLENWCWEEEALGFISGHYETGQPLPHDLLEKMLAAKNYQSAMQMVRQLEFSLFDLRLHMEYNGSTNLIQSILDQVRERVAVVKPPEFNRFQHSFGHIFAGGYAAGYYSYKWAEVLSADAFSRFEEEGIFNPDTGRSFMENILEKGGSHEPMELFKAFRGREPEVDALLRHSGIGDAA